MKLIAAQKDYYDHFARDFNLSDQTYRWERKPKIVMVDFAIPQIIHNGFDGWITRKVLTRQFEAYGFVIFFCGYAFPVVKVVRHNGTLPLTKEFFYSFEDLPDDVKGDPFCDGKYRKYRKSKGGYERYQDLFAIGDNLSWMQSEFTYESSAGRLLPRIPLDEMHRRVGSPIFCHPLMFEEHVTIIQESGIACKTNTLGRSVLEKPCVLVNPILNHVNFNQRLNAFAAFQALERYLSNEMAPYDARLDKPIPDKIKAQSKGFDKNSFRKSPSKNISRRAK